MIILPGRALRDGELFEIVIQKMVDRWSGSIEAGKRQCVCPLTHSRTRVEVLAAVGGALT